MNKKEAAALQEAMAKEAVALLRVTEGQGDTSKFERVIPLIGSTWWLPEENSYRCLDAIAKEKGGTQVFAEDCLPMNATPAETVTNLLALMETAMAVRTFQDCKTILELAQELAVTQNLLEELKEYTSA